MLKSHCGHTEGFLSEVVMIISLHSMALGNYRAGKEQSFRHVRTEDTSSLKVHMPPEGFLGLFFGSA